MLSSDVLEVDGYRRRGRLDKIWTDCVKDDMGKKDVDMTNDWEVLKRKTLGYAKQNWDKVS